MLSNNLSLNHWWVAILAIEAHLRSPVTGYVTDGLKKAAGHIARSAREVGFNEKEQVGKDYLLNG